jgi:hypothetical protein
MQHMQYVAIKMISVLNAQYSFTVPSCIMLCLQGPMLRGATAKHSSSSSSSNCNRDVISLRQRWQQQQQHDDATVDVMLSAEYTASNVPIRGMPRSTASNGMTANQRARAFASAIQQQQQQQQHKQEEQLKSDGMPTSTNDGATTGASTTAADATTAGDDQYRLVLYAVLMSAYTSNASSVHVYQQHELSMFSDVCVARLMSATCTSVCVQCNNPFMNYR